jgi:hypothetical protein
LRTQVGGDILGRAEKNCLWLGQGAHLARGTWEKNRMAGSGHDKVCDAHP